MLDVRVNQGPHRGRSGAGEELRHKETDRDMGFEALPSYLGVS